ncbi:DUF2913 family protein [Vibrio lentus]|uniref:DUF2913 family protein n=1 Tax=Vibrio lentus TaxID=136468 RepID=UPI000C8507F9|nr:DUF2913 family protein [Vibrio lentus]PMM38421.1 hypothetical protein BCT58_24370 [Vibrio lentus]
MSKNLKHYQASSCLVTHALFALYFQIQSSQGYTPIKRRNDILVKFIKAQQKKAMYASLKKEMKTMLAIGRNPKGNLEARLHDINQLNLEYKMKLTHADELYILFNHLFEAIDFPSQLADSETLIEEDILYMNPLEIEEGFDGQNNQIKPLAMTVKTHRLDALIGHVNAHEMYTIEVVNVKDDVISLLLHRKT